MKCAALFGCREKLTNSHHPVHCAEPPYYVRMVAFDANDLTDALDKATKLGLALGKNTETLLTTVSLE